MMYDGCIHVDIPTYTLSNALLRIILNIEPPHLDTSLYGVVEAE
jgi:hypothetical protein